MLSFTGIVAIAAAIFGALAFRDLRRVRVQLDAARASIDEAISRAPTFGTSEGRAAARADIDKGLGLIASARETASTSTTVSALKAVPGLSRQRDGLLRLIDDSTTAATAGRDLLVRVDEVANSAPLQDGAAPLAAFQQLGSELRATADTLARLGGSTVPPWGPLGDARRRFDDLADRNAERLRHGASALDAARSFIGGTGTRRYLIALQNNAEMRDQGAILSYAICRFDEGRLTFERSGSVTELALDRPAPTPIPEGTQKVFGDIQPTRLWQSVNATADFGWSGRAMYDMYRQATGEVVDGVVAIDVPGLAALLRILGPITVPGVAEPIGAHNLGRLLLHDFYQGLGPQSDQGPRRERQSDVTRAVIDRLTNGSRDAVALGRRLGEAAHSGHLRLWSSVADEQRAFEETGLSGGPATELPDRTFHVAVENRTATKLDYYVKPSVRQDLQLTPEGTVIVRTTVAVDNRAPVGAPPSYQLGPDTFTKQPGDYLAWVLLWGPAGSRQVGGIDESGLVLSQYVVDVAAGQRREVTYETVIPDGVRDGRLQIRFVPQPRLEPVALQVRLRAPGWDVVGATAWAGPWDGVKTLTWEVKR